MRVPQISCKRGHSEYARNSRGIRYCKACSREKSLRRHHSRPDKLEYASWVSMKSRCNNPNAASYKHYGGRGIGYVPSWEHYRNFARDMGKRLPGLSLGRLDNDADYSPGNCRWEDREQQSNNKSTTKFVEINKVRLSLTQWADRLALPAKTVRARIAALGWTPERALSVPLREDRHE